MKDEERKKCKRNGKRRRELRDTGMNGDNE